LDEAYLDLSHLHSSAESVAREIRNQISEELGITASAGIGPNKLIAKIASDWNKPDGQHEVRPEDVAAFMRDLPVGRLWGVGGKMRAKLESLGVKTCGDLQRYDKIEMARGFGKWGLELWELCRGIDHREVETRRIRKSISTENTFRENITSLEGLQPPLHAMLEELAGDVARYDNREIRSLVVKMKFADFTRTTAEKAHAVLETDIFDALLEEAWQRGGGKPVRLLGVGVRFRDPEEREQMELL